MVYGTLDTALLGGSRKGATTQHRERQLLSESGSVEALPRPARPPDPVARAFRAPRGPGQQKARCPREQKAADERAAERKTDLATLALK